MIYLYGAGGHAKVIVDILECCGIIIGGVFDKNPMKRVWDYPFFQFPGPFNTNEDQLIISIGNNEIRMKLAIENNVSYYTAIHPKSIVSSHVSIGEGTVVMAGALINSDTFIGKHCIINSNASIDHDCTLSDFVHISPNATLSGGVKVGKAAHVGSGAVIIPGKTIGSNAVIGAGAVVIDDIPDNVVAVGNPAKIIKKI